jgi:hypothetical protein
MTGLVPAKSPARSGLCSGQYEAKHVPSLQLAHYSPQVGEPPQYAAGIEL